MTTLRSFFWQCLFMATLMSNTIMHLHLHVPPISKRCNEGWFGHNCEYKCHCHKNCTISGECSEDLCLSGWFGEKCQYYDMLEYSNAPDWLTDDNDTSCNPDSTTEKIIITFKNPLIFTWFRIGFKETGDDNKFSITFNRATVSCTNQRIFPLADGRTLDFTCDITETITDLTISGIVVKNICVLHFSGGHNTALKQSVNQTSGPYVFRAELAVDGNKASFLEHLSCTRTNTSDPNPGSWNLFYKKPQRLYRVLLFNRNILQYRLNSFTLRTYSTDGTLIETYKEPGNAQSVYEVWLTNTSVGISRLTVTAQGVLTLCEVEAYGETICPKDKWGLTCSEDCACDRLDVCFPVSGVCVKGCPSGLYGFKCAHACPEGCKYKNCEESSGYCLECIEGYTGIKCETACPFGLYGIGCQQYCSEQCVARKGTLKNETCFYCDRQEETNYTGASCSAKCVNNTCDVSEGHCYNCNTGFYGEDCNLQCPHMCVNDICHIITGICTEGIKKDELTVTLPIPMFVYVACTGGLLSVLCTLLWYQRRREPDYFSDSFAEESGSG